MEPSRLTDIPNDHRRGGFTLIEILAVITIMAILFTLGGMVASGPIESMKLTEAAQSLTQQLARARQFAITKNREVEFRIYKADPNNEGEVAFRSFAYGVVEVITDPNDPDYQDPTSDDFAPPFVPAVGRSTLQEGVRFLDSAPYSTLISGFEGVELNIRKGSEPREDGTNAPYISFNFLPEGRVALDADRLWTLTVIREAEAQRDGSELRKNFVSIQLQPVSGRARTYRP